MGFVSTYLRFSYLIIQRCYNVKCCVLLEIRAIEPYLNQKRLISFSVMTLKLKLCKGTRQTDILASVKLITVVYNTICIKGP